MLNDKQELTNEEIRSYILQYRQEKDTNKKHQIEAIIYEEVKNLVSDYIIKSIKQFNLNSLASREVQEDLMQEWYIVFISCLYTYDPEYITKKWKKTQAKFSSVLYMKLQKYIAEAISKELWYSSWHFLKTESKKYHKAKEDLKKIREKSSKDVEEQKEDEAKILELEALLSSYKPQISIKDSSTYDDSEDDKSEVIAVSEKEESKSYDVFLELIKSKNINLSKQEYDFLYNLYFTKDCIDTLYTEEEVEIYSRNIKNRIESHKLELKRQYRNTRLKIKAKKIST